MNFNETANLEERWGPKWKAIQYVRDVMIPALDKERTLAILDYARLQPESSEVISRHAFEAARSAGGDRERQMVQASEDLRAAIWNVIWDSTWVDAWHLSWVVSKVGFGLSLVDIMHDGKFDRGEYIHLVAPWLMGGFPDYNIWSVVNHGEEDDQAVA